jgi:hypothetical protein
LTIDLAYLCGTTCRKSEKIKAIKRKNENLERIRDKANETSSNSSIFSKKNVNIALMLFLEVNNHVGKHTEKFSAQGRKPK